MVMSDSTNSVALHVAKQESSPPLRTALPSRAMSSKVEDTTLAARSPPPETGIRHGRSPSPLKPEQLDRSPSAIDRQASQPLSPVSSANEPALSDSMTDAPPLPAGTISTQSGQVCR